MSEIKIIEKPQEISFQTIKDVLHRAHSVNFAKGLVMHTTELSAEELEAYLGDEGKCFVAMDGDQVVGTISLRVREKNTWYAHGKVVDEVLGGVLPEYGGKHVFSSLSQKAEEYIRENGYSIIVFNTATENKRVQEIHKKNGFHYVSFFAAEDNDHYSVIMAKWLNKCPFSKTEIWLRYNKKKLAVIMRYKPGKIKRFSV